MKTENDFFKKFGDAEVSEDGSMFFKTFGEDFDIVTTKNPRHVWAVKFGENNERTISPVLCCDFTPEGYVLVSCPITDEEMSSDDWSDVLCHDNISIDVSTDLSAAPAM